MPIVIVAAALAAALPGHGLAQAEPEDVNDFSTDLAMVLGTAEHCQLAIESLAIVSYLEGNVHPSVLEFAGWLDSDIWVWNGIATDLAPDERAKLCSEASAMAEALGLARPSSFSAAISRIRTAFTSAFRSGRRQPVARAVNTSLITGVGVVAGSAEACGFELNEAAIDDLVGRVRGVPPRIAGELSAATLRWKQDGIDDAAGFLAEASADQKLAHCFVVERTARHYGLLR